MAASVNPVAAFSTDARFVAEDSTEGDDPVPYPRMLIVTARGQVMQLPLALFRQPSTRSGRKFCRLRSGDRVVAVQLIGEAETLFLATRQSRVLHFRLDEIPALAAAGRGVIGIRVTDDDEVLGAVQLYRPGDCLRVISSTDRQLSFGQMKYQVASRGGKGIRTSQRNTFREIISPPIELVDWAELGEE